MPEGTQLISLTKTFASQILKDYPDSLENTGLDSIEAYMDHLAKADIFSRWRRRFINMSGNGTVSGETERMQPGGK